jgi:hypothetical protein
MSKIPIKCLLLSLIVAFSFAYRMLLILWQIFPPGADIGFHNSIIHSIIGSGNTNFLWNNYHMGGVTSLTFPGYHIFVSNIILLTGMPDYLAHSLVVSFFSSFIVLSAFLLTRIVWGEPASWIIAFLVAVSRFDIEMLMWGGYPNVITLLLIPLIFYLYLENPRFSLFSFLTITSILSGAIFLTHSLSSVMFAAITVATVVLVLLFSKKVGMPKKRLIIWLMPLLFGAIIVFPFLLDIVPAYIDVGGEPFTGAVGAIRLAVLTTRVLPFELVLTLFICVPCFFLFSKLCKGRFLAVPTLLFAMWILVPTVLTQGFLVGLYVDYHRFLYFIILPVLILITIAIDNGSRLFLRRITARSSISKETLLNKGDHNKQVPRLTSKNLYIVVILSCLLIFFLFVPIFINPYEGDKMSGFYQVISEPNYEAIQWIRQEVPVESVLVSDALYGWWVSGFAQRPTLSAVDPQFLTLAREVEAAEIAKGLLDTNYIVDNGLIQVRADGGYIGRNNPLFLGKLLDNSTFPYPFLHFNSDEMTVLFSKGNTTHTADITQIPVKSMQIEANSDHALILVSKENQFFNVTQKTTIYRGVRFVNMSLTVDSTLEDISIQWVRLVVRSEGAVIHSKETLAVFDEHKSVYGQLIFTKHKPEIRMVMPENPSVVELLYSLDGATLGVLELFVGVAQLTGNEASNINRILMDNLDSYLERIAPDSPITIFDYRKALSDYKISYIICRDLTVIPKFANDPDFSLVFINDHVAIFMVKSNFNQVGRTP